jgi:MFS family permease
MNFENETLETKSSASPGAVLTIVLLSYLIIVLDISIVITGLPEIRQTLGFSPIGLSCVQNAYLLCFGGFLLLAARTGDIPGRKRMLLLGLSLFTASSFAIGIAQTPVWLIGARAMEGIGAAILAPTVLSLIATTFPEGPERTRALAYYSMVAGAGASFGLVLGGIFADQLSWRVGFLMNVPIGIGLIMAAARLLVESKRTGGAFDIFGAICSTLGMGALVYGIVRSAEAGWSDPLTLSVLGLSLALLALFIFNEARVRQPILLLRLFASRERSGAFAARMLFLGAMVSFFFFSTQYMQLVLGFSPLQPGIGFLPMTIPTFMAATTVTSLTRRFGNAGVLCLALAFTTVGMFWLGQAGPHADFVMDIALPMILIGLGNGAALGPLTVAGVAGVEDRDQGAASGLVNVAHQIGGTLGLGILIVIFASADAPLLNGAELLSHRISAVMTVGGVMMFFALLIALVFVRPSTARSMASVGTKRPDSGLVAEPEAFAPPPAVSGEAIT